MKFIKNLSLLGFCLLILPYSGYCATLQVPSSQYPTIQSAIDAANLGDIIVLEAGTHFVENITLKYKPGNDFITIQSSALNSLPNLNNRVSPNDAIHMPKLSSPFSGEPVITTELTSNGNPAHHYKLVGLEIASFSSTNTIQDLVRLGRAGVVPGEPVQDTLEKVPYQIIIDRCYIHGQPQANSKNGIVLNSASTEIKNSYISDIHSNILESHGIVGWNGPGPYQISNNYVEAAGINILFGGADPDILNLIPTDIEVNRNYLKKLSSWLNTTPQSNQWIVKNNFELKNARFVIIEDNIFETNWSYVVGHPQNQKGTGVLFTVRNQEGNAPWSTIEDVIFRYNIIKDIPQGISILPDDYVNPSDNVKNLTIENNLILTDRGPFGFCFELNGATLGSPGVENLTLNHNSCITFEGNNQRFISGEEDALVSNLSITNNIASPIDNILNSHLNYSSVNGTDALNSMAGNSWNFLKNLLVFNSGYNFWVTQYPTNNFYVQNISNILFENIQNGQFQLSQSSPYKNQGTDGKDVGADILNLNIRTACTESGIQTNCPLSQSSYPGPNTPNTPTIIEVENFDKGGQDVAYNDTFGTTGSSAYRSNPVEAVDIRADSNASNGFEVFEASEGEWYEYTINVPYGGNYDIGVRYASLFNGGKFHIEIDGVNISGQLTANSTGGWSTFRRATKRNVALSAGTHVLRLAMDTNSPDGCVCVIADFDSILFTRTQFDFDGDGLSDISVFRPSNNTWYLQQSTGGFSSITPTFSTTGDILVPSDYDGDGKTDVAHWKDGTWKILFSSTNTTNSFSFGSTGDIPTPGDFDGDGISDAAVFRPSNSTWYVLNSLIGTTITTFGTTGDLPVSADYDGDGRADIAIYRPSSGQWWINRSSAGLFVTTFGVSTDKTVPADYTGDGKADIAFFRPSTGYWYILRSDDTQFYAFPFGASGDMPAPGDYDGDGRADAAVFRSSDLTWYLQQSSSGFTAFGFGSNGDIPIPSVFVR